VQTESSSCASSISQAGAQAALNGPQDSLSTMLHAYKLRHDFVVAQLNAMSGLAALPNQGTFYSFINASAAMAALGYEDDIDLVENILKRTGVALVPGSAFGLPEHFRLSYATHLSLLQQACERLAVFFNH